MDRKIVAALLMCAAMVLVVAAPSALSQEGTVHEIIKGPKGPRASAVTWEFVPPDYGVWYGHVVNNGLRWIVVDVYENSMAVPEEVSHQRIRFAAYDAFPAGELDTSSVVMSPTHTYLITVTPNGPRGSSCTVEDVFKAANPPVAVIDVLEINWLTVTVSGANSYDMDGSIVSYAWDFGDGATAMGQTATHTYAWDGTYTIKLVVKDNDGLEDDAMTEVTVVHQPMPPTASFTYTKNYLAVNFDGSGSSDPDGTVVAWNWEFGDGMTGSGKMVSHTYAAAGTYTVKLTVTDNEGLTGWTSKDVMVSEEPPPQYPPTASFTYTKNYLAVNFDGSGSSDPDGTVVAWNWEFGDMMTGSGKMVSHTYGKAGTYTVKLTVTDNDGLTGWTAQSITVEEEIDNPPIAYFTYTVDGLTVHVDASGSSDDKGIVSYQWNWGDGSPMGSGMTASHTYSKPAGAPKLAPDGNVHQAPPPPPYYIFGYTKDTLGNPIPECTVTITNLNTGNYVVVMSDATAFYMYDLNNLGWAIGNTIHVLAEKGTLVGEAQAIADGQAYIYLDVTLQQTGPTPFDVTITLTVTDTKGQTATYSVTITLYA